MWAQKLRNGLKKGFFNRDRHFIQRWPSNPKIAVFGPPNVFREEIAQRLAIDLGIPVVSVTQILQNVQAKAGANADLSHPFFMKVKEMLDNGQIEDVMNEEIPLKMLRLSPHAQEGFILVDFPRNVCEAEMLEQFRGGMNAFVHISLPDEILVDIEESKMTCNHCGRKYYTNDIVDHERGIYIKGFMPEDPHCTDCGSKDIDFSGDPILFEEMLETYKSQKDDLLAFYDHHGLLVDFELKKGFENFDQLKQKIQFTAKH